MGMFGMGESPEIKLEREMTQKQLDASKEQTVVNATADDQVMLNIQSERADLTRWQQDLRDEEQRIVFDLKNYFYNNEKDMWEQKTHFVYNKIKDEWEQKPMRPLLNDAGVQMILTEIKPFLSRNMMMSNLKEERILMLLKNTSDTIADNLVDHYPNYNIENDIPDMDHIMRIIKNTITPTPFRSLNNGERNFLNTMNKRIETHTGSSMDEEKKGMKSIFKT